MGQRSARVWLDRVGRALLCLAVPVTLLLTSVRLLLTPAFVRLDYALPGFPADPFGFSKPERIRGADVALEYLLNDEPIAFLGDLRFDDGSPVYNARELKHMEDVKGLVQKAMTVWLVSLAASLLLPLGLGQLTGEACAWGALRTAARGTLVLMGVLLIGIAASFSFLFVGFHRVFFEGDTWLFLYSDTLIRLFPERFWLTAFVAIGLGTVGLTLVVLLVSSLRMRRLARGA